MSHGYMTYDCSYPKDTATKHPSSFLGDCSIVDDAAHDRKILSFDDETGWAEDAAAPLTEFFGRRLDKVPGLELELSYDAFEDDFAFCLEVKDGKFAYTEAVTTYEPLPMSMCPVDVIKGCDDGDEGDIDDAAKVLIARVHRWICALADSYEPPVRALASAYAFCAGGIDVVLGSLGQTARQELDALGDDAQAFFVAHTVMEQSKQVIDSALSGQIQDIPIKWDADECARQLAECAN